MAVNPLDLQTNFIQVSNVGKQQTQMKEQEILRQDSASEHLHKKSEKDAEDVPEAKDPSKSEKLKNEKEKNKEKKQEAEEKEKNKEKKQEAEEKEKREAEEEE